MNQRRRRHSWPEWPSDPIPLLPVAGRPSLIRRLTVRRDLSHDVLKQESLAEITGTPGLDQLECVKAVQRGADLCKYGHRGSPHFRFFYVDATGSMLQWWSHKKKLEDTIVTFSDVHRLQIGQHTPVFQRFSKYRTKELKRRSFSLIYGPDGEKSLDIVCGSREEFLLWARALRFLITRVSNTKKVDPYRSLLIPSWNRAFVRENGVLDADAVSRLLFDMNIHYSKSQCKALFETANVNRHDLIDFSTMMRLSLRLRSSPSVYSEIFRPYADSSVEKLTVNLEEMIFFLRTEQQMDIDKSEGLAIMSKFIMKEGGRNPPRLRIYELILYLMDEDNTLFDPQRLALYQDMNRPLTDYFINSSHNTYLESDQLKGASSTKMYVKALQEGCRSVEIDCWDGPNGEPVVYHGFTLTSRVFFRDVIQSVADHAFDASPYPVTLSFENHCSLPYQRQMAHHLKTILGDRIAYPQEDHSRMLPSPESLKHRIIIKAKFFFDSVQRSDATRASSLKPNQDDPLSTTAPASSLSFTDSFSEQTPTVPYNERRIAPELAALVLLQAKKFVSFDQLRGATACQMTSFSEKKVAKLIKKGLAGRFVCYNSQNLSRVYPSQFRVDSSNLDPFQPWTLGCQMVALNFQTADLPKLMNIGRFMENDNCGYVLKPEQLRRFSKAHIAGAGDEDYEQTIRMSSGSNFVFTHITLTVIGAFHLPKPAGNPQCDVVDPYVKICIRGLSADCKEFKTGVVLGNGFNPTWNQTFDIGVNGPHCAMISFQIFDKKKYQEKVIAQAAVPFGCMRLGYRNVPLLSATMQKIPFCNLIIRTCKAE